MVHTLNKMTAGALTLALAAAPLPSLAHSYAQGDLVIAPDPAFVAAALQKSHELFALEQTGTIPPVAASHPAAVANRPLTINDLINPATGKPFDASAQIEVHGKNGAVQTVTASAYVANINSMERALNDRGASLRDKAPVTIVNSIGDDPGAFSKALNLPQARIPTLGQLSSDTGALSSASTGGAPLPGFALPPAQPVPHGVGLAAAGTAKICLNSGAATGVLQQSTTGISSAPSPSPTPRSRIGSQITAFPIKPGATPTPTATPTRGLTNASSAGTINKTPVDETPAYASAQAAAQEIAYEQLKCPQPVSPMPPSVAQADLSSTLGINNNSPLSWGVGDNSVAAVDFTGGVTVTSTTTNGQPVPTLAANVTGQGYIFNHEKDFLDANAHTGGSSSGIDVSVVGQSVFSVSFTNGENKNSKQTNFQLLNETAAIPIIDGINLDLNAQVSGYLTAGYDLNISKTTLVDSLTVTATAGLTGFFSAAIDVSIYIADVSAGMQATITFLKLNLTAVGGLGLIMVDRTIGGAADHNPRDIRDCQLNLTYIDGVSSSGTALSGNVAGYVQECVDYFFGSSCAKQTLNIASWNGFNLSGALGNPKWQNVPFGPHYTDGPEYGIPLTGTDVYSADNSKAEPAACAQFPVVFAN